MYTSTKFFIIVSQLLYNVSIVDVGRSLRPDLLPELDGDGAQEDPPSVTAETRDRNGHQRRCKGVEDEVETEEVV